ncbi:MAG: hypothetical protein GX869_06265, partial [Candidatus Cloacimonetes bacterium]|nr:hypothetical protein [Candidatus Cloacimonadota bacterium]
MKKFLLIIICLGLLSTLLGQGIDDLIFQENKKDSEQEIIKVNFEKKDARLAMLYSAVLPGAGQFYAKPSAVITYIFPILEVAMIGGMIYYDKQGDEKTKDYEKYANGEIVTHTFNYNVGGVDYSYTYTGTRYRRDYQTQVQNVLKNINAFDIYDETFFRLDQSDTQHFYEDIGKYNKYIFGWADWYHRFATDPTSGDGTFIMDDPAYEGLWVFTGSTDPQLIQNRRWYQNYTVEDFMNGNLSHPISPKSPEASPWRQEYINMRKDANKQYDYS